MRTPTSRCAQASSAAALGITVYLIGFGWSWHYDVPLLVLASCGVAAVVLQEPGRGSGSRALVAPIACFLLASALSLACTADVSRSARLSSSVVPALLLFLLVTRSLAETRDVAGVYLALAVAALVLGLRILVATLVRSELAPAAVVRTIGSPLLLVPNDVVMLARVAPLSLGLTCWARGATTKIAAITSVLVSVLAIVALQSRMAVATLLGSLLYFAVYARRGAVLSVFALAAIVLGAEALRGWPMLRKPDLVANPRLALWMTALAMARDAPILGHGPHTFGVLRPSYLPRLEFPEWLHPDDRVVPWAHNLYLEILAEAGVLGFVALVVLLAAAVTRAVRGVRAHAHAPTQPLAVGACAALCGFCWVAAFELTFLRQWVVVTMFTLLGLAGYWGSDTVAGTHSSRAPKTAKASDSS